jgi:hypothetical protein
MLKVFVRLFSFLARFWMNTQYPKAQEAAIAGYWPERKIVSLASYKLKINK